jgi:hypothetical protein
MTLCTFGPPGERKRLWILMFEDRDMGDMYFNAEAEALAAFERCAVTWNCTLFSTVDDRGARE